MQNRKIDTMYTNESAFFEKEMSFASADEEEEDDAKYLTQLIQKTYQSAVINFILAVKGADK